MASTSEHSAGWYYGVSDGQLGNKERWATFWVMFVVGFMSMYGVFRAAPILLVIGTDFGFDLSNVGLINSAFGLTGLIFAFPAAAIMRKFGIKRTFIVSIVLTLTGSVIGYFATSASVFLFSRFLEGSGGAIICVLGPNVVPRLFPPNRQGFIMSIWSLWAPVGIFLALITTPHIYNAFGWRSVWLISIIINATCLIWAIKKFRLSAVDENVLAATDKNGRVNFGKPDMRSAIAMGILFIVWNFVFVGGFNQYYSTFLQEVKGLSVASAGFIPSLVCLFTVPLCIFFGWLADKIHTKKWFVVIGYALLALDMFAFAWVEGGGMATVWIGIGVLTVSSALVPMATRASIPEYAKETAKIDYSLTIMAFVTQISLVAGVVIGTAFSSFGWFTAGAGVLGSIAAAGALLTAVLCRNDFRKDPSEI